ncbi:hypothetical protein BcepSauron_381 [Burkholderia phage BcepSauron]|uniref:Uncharacterized protein n=2 Tax=Sarumanvirus TaxID=2843450 RepID=A0A482ML29_9CAUD|nr:hypothetical protein H1O16_gp378 [Burkholderia phage BcepSaruman]YP_009904759.1 hypothetical protein H1O17_gp381 [Burkholderia phage BcepSauron]QBQ74761.1 hypothetical protein BcepSauron_381 [Burkholderia phage BcepSauron]QBX06791.1 hypothetical protein BcepSaruman_378 [Burkholderia phage BcepSaruman]
MTYNQWKDKLFEIYRMYRDTGRGADAQLAMAAECHRALHLESVTYELVVTPHDMTSFTIDMYIKDPDEPEFLVHEQFSDTTMGEWAMLNSLMTDFDVQHEGAMYGN